MYRSELPGAVSCQMKAAHIIFFGDNKKNDLLFIYQTEITPNNLASRVL